MRPLLPVLFLISCNLMFAQTYTFSVTNQPYQDLENSTSLNNGKTWDDPQYHIPMSFEFKLFSTTIGDIYIDDIGFGGILTEDSSDFNIKSLIIPFGSDIIDRGYDFNFDSTAISLSNISYEESGNAGDRILKIEWNNVGFYSELEDDLVSTDYTNFQLWLYESSGDIEVRFGPTNIAQPQLSYDGDPGPIVALIDGYDYWTDTVRGDIIFLEGDPAAPDMIVSRDLEEGGYLVGNIPEGTVYRFSRQTSGIASEYTENISIYPNPASRSFTIEGLGELNLRSLELLTSTGRVVRQFPLEKGPLNVSDLLPGSYLLNIVSDKGNVVKRVVIK